MIENMGEGNLKNSSWWSWVRTRGWLISMIYHLRHLWYRETTRWGKIGKGIYREILESKKTQERKWKANAKIERRMESKIEREESGS